MISFSKTTLTAYVCAGMMLFSSQEAKPVQLATKAFWTAATIIALHCYWKNVKPMEALKDESLLECIANARSYEEIKYLVQRWILGHTGKSSGIKVVGSAIDLQGKRSALMPHVAGDSQELVLYTYKGIEAYGLCGASWSYVKMIYDALKAVKDLNEVTTYWGITEAASQD
jgi:hypothetical protein